jgi:transposase InsO family protein
MAWTGEDGWGRLFVTADHYKTEAWTYVSRIGDRIAALNPDYKAVIDRFGRPARAVNRTPHDSGPHYRSHHFGGTVTWLGMTDSPAFIGDLETNGCAERFIRTLNEQYLWVKLCDTVDDLRVPVADWTRTYNTGWPIGRHGHLTPHEALPARCHTRAA